MPWPDAMMPIAQNYTAVERAILECAWAGCETIWVVCNQDISRVLKNKIGEFVYDPVRSYFKHKTPEGFNTVMFKKYQSIMFQFYKTKGTKQVSHFQLFKVLITHTIQVIKCLNGCCLQCIM